MVAITTVGLDIAKFAFQVHGVDARGSAVVRRQLKRRYVLAFLKKLPPCLVGIEACATSHHWSSHADRHWALGSLSESLRKSDRGQAITDRFHFYLVGGGCSQRGTVI